MPIFKSEQMMWDYQSADQNLKPSDSEINEKYNRGEGRIVVENNREKLPGFVDQLNKPGYMDLRPFYQRRPRWTVERQSLLIESFIMNVPVPPIFLYEQNYNSYEVMDGQQRITAIKDFYNNKFSLKNLQHWPELNGRFYRNLPSMVRSGIDRRSISSIVMLKESAPQDEEAMILRQIVFERLNTGGVELERQEIRNAMYQGKMNDLINELSCHDCIRMAWNLPLYESDELVREDRKLMDSPFFQKMEDAEMVLRFFALRNVKNYRRGMQGFLDIYMMKSSFLSDDDISNLKDLFEQTIDLAFCIYGDLLFRPYDAAKGVWAKGPQKAFYDAVMVGLSDFLQSRGVLVSQKNTVIKETQRMFEQNDEGAFTGRGNTKADIENRIYLYKKMISRVL